MQYTNTESNMINDTYYCCSIVWFNLNAYASWDYSMNTSQALSLITLTFSKMNISIK